MNLVTDTLDTASVVKGLAKIISELQSQLADVTARLAMCENASSSTHSTPSRSKSKRKRNKNRKSHVVTIDISQSESSDAELTDELQARLNSLRDESFRQVVPNTTGVPVTTSNRFDILTEPEINFNSFINIACYAMPLLRDGDVKSGPFHPITAPIRITIVGSSLVRGLGLGVYDRDSRMKAVSYPHPGARASQIQVSKCVSRGDDVLFVMGGSNNIGKGDSLETCKASVDCLVRDAVRSFPDKPILISEIPPRYDISEHKKIRYVNAHIRNLCRKNKDLHLVSNAYERADLEKDGLHLSEKGKRKLSRSISKSVMCILSRSME